MLKTRNFGRKSLKEIKDILNHMNLSLGMQSKEWSVNMHQKYEKKNKNTENKCKKKK